SACGNTGPGRPHRDAAQRLDPRLRRPHARPAAAGTLEGPARRRRLRPVRRRHRHAAGGGEGGAAGAAVRAAARRSHPGGRAWRYTPLRRRARRTRRTRRALTLTPIAVKNPPTARSILEYGLASGNVGLVQLLGLCPLLAVSNNAVNALGLGLATLLAVTATNTVISLLRHLSGREVRIPAFVMVIAAVVTAIELAIRAWLPGLHAVLGLFIPLIVTNCALMGRAEAFA